MTFGWPKFLVAIICIEASVARSQEAAPILDNTTASAPSQPAANSSEAACGVSPTTLPYDAQLVESLVSDAIQQGDIQRGAGIFADAKLACTSCHRIGLQGGTVGPDLTVLAQQRTPQQIVESVLWPEREVKPEFVSWKILTVDGEILTGYKLPSSDTKLQLRELTSEHITTLAKNDIERETAAGTVMPAGLTASMSRQQQIDLFRFLNELGRTGGTSAADVEQMVVQALSHTPAEFSFSPAPLAPEHWPHADHYVNRDRVYDFYTKQADYFRQQPHPPHLLPAASEMDGGKYGHWGNQNEQTWESDRWNQTELGSVQAGVFQAAGLTVARGVCVRLGEQHELSACFDPDTLRYVAVWKEGFVSFSPVRHGFMSGLLQQGTSVPVPEQPTLNQPFTYHGFYRQGNRVVFAYRIGEVEFLDAPWVVDGQFVREVAPLSEHSLRNVLSGGPIQWPQVISTAITPGASQHSQSPPSASSSLALDTIELPVDNPWRALIFCGGIDFLPDGSALVCTMQGDVWQVSGLDSDPERPGTVRWKRFAAGLHHALGLVVRQGRIYVQCRDQLTRLTDLNADGEADFYECFSNAFITSPAGHDYICGLECDSQGNFYTASGNQGLLQISPDGAHCRVLATGFRNPDGLGLIGDQAVTVPCSEGEWTPASMICRVALPHSNSSVAASLDSAAAPHFGYGGPHNGQPPQLPLCYLPRQLDNSSGGQTTVPSDTWGPLAGQMLHFSFGAASWFTVLQDEVDGLHQGALVPMTGNFLSGAHRARFSPHDRQLYVCGMQGWGSYSNQDGCLQRVRYRGDDFQVLTAFHLHQNGVLLTFAKPVDATIVGQLSQHFAQAWNYRYSGAYGSPEYSPTHPGVVGHDTLRIAGAHVLEDGRSLFLEIPDLQPVSQLHLRMNVNSDHQYPVCNPAGSGHDVFITAHRLDNPFTEFPGYAPQPKTIAAHPLLYDMALTAPRIPNPWREAIAGARQISIETGKNLTYVTPILRARSGEPLSMTLENPDVVPHNWVLIKPGKLPVVGEMANQLIADPEAFARHYIPESEAIICYTDIVQPASEQTIHFHAPQQPGRYPFLCTFPGHWMVMNGVLKVE